MEFRWIEWNIEHIREHGVSSEEAEEIILRARPPFPEARGDGKWAVWGEGWGGRLVQVVFIAEEDDTAFVIHARSLTDREKHQYRRRRR